MTTDGDHASSSSADNRTRPLFILIADGAARRRDVPAVAETGQIGLCDSAGLIRQGDD